MDMDQSFGQNLPAQTSIAPSNTRRNTESIKTDIQNEMNESQLFGNLGNTEIEIQMENLDNIDVMFEEIRSTQMNLCSVMGGHKFGLVDPDFDDFNISSYQ